MNRLISIYTQDERLDTTFYLYVDHVFLVLDENVDTETPWGMQGKVYLLTASSLKFLFGPSTIQRTLVQHRFFVHAHFSLHMYKNTPTAMSVSPPMRWHFSRTSRFYSGHGYRVWRTDYPIGRTRAMTFHFAKSCGYSFGFLFCGTHSDGMELEMRPGPATNSCRLLHVWPSGFDSRRGCRSVRDWYLLEGESIADHFAGTPLEWRLGWDTLSRSADFGSLVRFAR